MRSQSRRFVVEVKRGTNRAAFVSPDPTAERFRGAEAMLFGGRPKTEPEAKPPEPDKAGASGGRILRSLVEPPPPTLDEMFPPVRRGRKPGSKNKPKPVAPTAEAAVPTERPRRGRKPGSKNKPKIPPNLEAFVPSANALAAMRIYGILEEGTVEASATPAEAAPPVDVAVPRRSRLRDRSAVLKRYVLDAEPRPGQPGSLRSRRLARSAR